MCNIIQVSMEKDVSLKSKVLACIEPSNLIWVEERDVGQKRGVEVCKAEVIGVSIILGTGFNSYRMLVQLQHRQFIRSKIHSESLHLLPTSVRKKLTLKLEDKEPDS